MIIRTSDQNHFSFGRLSDPGVMQQSPLYNSNPVLEHFSTANFQYIVDHIVEMFGYARGTVRVAVDGNDMMANWLDLNHNQQMEDDEITFEFTMNASMNTYLRESAYGRHFMYTHAAVYGYPIIFGIAAHEMGHLVSSHALNVLQTELYHGQPALFVKQTLHPYWDELCADYLAGVIMANAAPPLDHEPFKRFLGDTVGGKTHPDGYLRVLAAEMGYLWGRNNPPAVTDQTLMQVEGQRQLLISFFQAYYQHVYPQIDPTARAQMTTLPHYLLTPCQLLVGYL